MRSIFAIGVAVLVACGSNTGTGDDDGSGGKRDACVGLECEIVDCAANAMPPTTLTGVVYAPNGTLPLYGIDVYVPREDPGPMSNELECTRCASTLPGSPIVRTITDEGGRFRLEDVPVGADIPLVIATGKWRRQIRISNVPQCTETQLTPTQTSLPKNKGEGDIPKIAITTGNADALECLVRKLGIDDAEITTNAGAGRIHLYAGNGANAVGAASMANARALWDSFETLKSYDIAIFSCEGGQNVGNANHGKSQDAMNAVKQYADVGGRVFLSHWHNVWVSGHYQGGGGSGQTPAVWNELAMWGNNSDPGNGTVNLIDETSNGKGPAFATWMLNVMGSTVRGEIPLENGTAKSTMQSLDTTRAERWTYLRGGSGNPQNFQFTTPNEVQLGERCGKVVFSDMHVSGDSRSRAGTPYPNDCSNSPLTPQEKALAFMFFDIASCIGAIF